eukprot:Plantae.Rhodophyta-Purpureofilum_apyrenoidigerum.ctg14198.p1 GENE.Plantae.Rhodophyta-Purpureofilum_apyrenoidigerum.ctg14198~~Plantae.Rhodophyta-Purpureofilum_apyrenoidigerum.ctg14198.p1  ORF type:complete len:177 (-),score=33.58 Plantae.Rhodophyta-Purpureofilum_apyrenoidigerum.ctg14198:175-705(-)
MASSRIWTKLPSVRLPTERLHGTAHFRTGLVDVVTGELKDAMKKKDQLKLRVLRNVRAGMLNRMKEDGSDQLADTDALSVLRRVAKQHVESIEMYRSAGRNDLVESEEKELEVVRFYLPQLADEATTRRYVEEAVKGTGVDSPRGAGRVMGQIMKEHKGSVDAALAKRLLHELLGS